MIHPAGLHGLHVETLSGDQVAAVFPLMHAADSSLSPAIWRQFARRATTGSPFSPQGVLIARRAGLKFPSGAVCFKRHHDLHHAAVLTVEHFVALDLLYPDRVIAALITGLEAAALRLGCTTIRSLVKNDATIVTDMLHQQGHKLEGVTMTKRLAVPAPSKTARK